VHIVQKVPDEVGEAGWFSFNNKKDLMSAIERKSKLKNWKYDFLFVKHRGDGEPFLGGTMVSRSKCLSASLAMQKSSWLTTSSTS